MAKITKTQDGYELDLGLKEWKRIFIAFIAAGIFYKVSLLAIVIDPKTYLGIVVGAAIAIINMVFVFYYTTHKEPTPSDNGGETING